MLYLLEIKNRIILLNINYFITLFICYYYKEVLFFLVIVESYKDFNTIDFYFIFTNITEIFSVYLELIVLISFQIICFYIFYSIFIFLSPAFFFKEYKYFIFVFYFIIFFWLFSLFLSNYVLIPFIWNFFLSFQMFSIGQFFYFEAKLLEYFNFCIFIYYFCLVYCQVFSFFFLFFIDVYSKKIYIKKFRKIYYYCFVILATLISPPEVYSQILIGLILIFFYELVILFFMYNLSLNLLSR